MAARVVVDPITRIEGHLRIEAQMDGEEFPAGPRASVVVLPRVIRLIVPRAFLEA